MSGVMGFGIPVLGVMGFGIPVLGVMGFGIPVLGVMGFGGTAVAPEHSCQDQAAVLTQGTRAAMATASASSPRVRQRRAPRRP